MTGSYGFSNTVQVWKKDNVFQHLEVLRRNRVKRRQYNEIFVEGVQAIELAIAGGWAIKSFIYARERELSRWAVDIIQSEISEDAIELPEPLMAELSDKDHASELLAVVHRKDDSLAIIPTTQPFMALLIDRSTNPGNLGTIIRTCDSFGISGVVLSGHSVDPFDPKVIRASVGTVFSVPVATSQSQKDIQVWIEEIRGEFEDLNIIGTSAHSTVPINTCDFSHPSVLIVGNETHGMSDFLKSISDRIVNIPLRGKASSLNVASATSIALYEYYRQNSSG